MRIKLRKKQHEAKMMQNLKKRLNKKEYDKLVQVSNKKLYVFISKYTELCNPDKVFVCTDSPEDIQYIRDAAIRNREEAKLATKGHTIHFDGYFDQARDKKNTKFLVPKGINLDAICHHIINYRANLHDSVPKSAFFTRSLFHVHCL